MAIFELFSKREKKRNQITNDPYQYTELPRSLRVQIVHIWKDVAGEGSAYYNFSSTFWEVVHNTMIRELGLFTLSDKTDDDYRKCVDFLLSSSNENALDIIDCTFYLFKGYLTQLDSYFRESSRGGFLSPQKAIKELNYRFRESGVGYQFEAGELIRVDSSLIHEELTKPVISLLYNLEFQGAEDEYLKAHKHYREGRYKEAIAEALKSFESTMKTICVRMNWEFKPSDTSNKLIDLLVKKELIPLYMQQHFNSLRSTLESGVPVLRNKTSGHGQGEETVEIPEHYASYALHLSASNILFLAKCYLDKKK
ncbi:STM4504/CBY_0614 family protein [Paenibacillus sp. JJ1722]|uniref:STM4504/CBY_0614 family protein n=1 Tax=Paenibacillus sp. JJ1722 TaxID=3398770 RepID=UPI003AB018E1